MSRMSGYIILWANISGSKKDREETQHASESWTSQLSREKKILKIGAWVKELFHFLCRYSDFVRAHTFFSHNSHVSESISKILFSSESLAWQLSEEKKILKIGSETRELWANLHRQFLHFLKFLLFSTIFHRGLRTDKIGVTAQKMQYLRNPCSDFQNLFFPWKLRCSAFRGMLCILSIFSRTRDISSQSDVTVHTGHIVPL